jgi:phage major head subunit gpT-like protein
MGVQLLSSRAIIGTLVARLEQDAGAGWTGRVANYFRSDQEGETYAWLGQIPSMREWVGGRQAKGLSTFSITIKNLDFEATLKILQRDLRRDKTSQIDIRIAELAQRSNSHWASLLSALIAAGTSSNCYDGKKFFAGNHQEGKSPSQSNLLTVQVADEDAPTAGEFEKAILAAVEQFYSLKDNEGEPLNENARQFQVLVGPRHFSVAAAALKNPYIVDGGQGRTNTLVNLAGYSFDLQMISRLSDVGSSFFVFRTDSETKALIMQEEQQPEVQAIAEGSELEFNEKCHHYGVHAIRNAGYGMWQRAVAVDFATSS